MEKNTIADRLRELRAQKGVNQDTAAEACGISRVGLARYETNQRIPQVKIAARLADYYGVSVHYLLGEEDTKKESSPAQEKAPALDIRAEAKQLLEGLSDDQYQAALQYLQFLKTQKG